MTAQEVAQTGRESQYLRGEIGRVALWLLCDARSVEAPCRNFGASSPFHRRKKSVTLFAKGSDEGGVMAAPKKRSSAKRGAKGKKKAPAKKKSSTAARAKSSASKRRSAKRSSRTAKRKSASPRSKSATAKAGKRTAGRSRTTARKSAQKRPQARKPAAARRGQPAKRQARKPRPATPNASEMMVVDTVREIAPGVVEVDEYIVQANRPGEQLGGAAREMPGGAEEE